MTNKYLEKIAEMSVEDKKAIERGYDTYLGRTFVHGTIGGVGGALAGAAAGAIAGNAAKGAEIGGHLGSLAGLGSGIATAHKQNTKLDQMLYGSDVEKKEALKKSMRQRGELSTLGRTLGSLNYLGLGGVESHMYNKKLRNIDNV